MSHVPKMPDGEDAATVTNEATPTKSGERVVSGRKPLVRAPTLVGIPAPATTTPTPPPSSVAAVAAPKSSAHASLPPETSRYSTPARIEIDDSAGPPSGQRRRYVSVEYIEQVRPRQSKTPLPRAAAPSLPPLSRPPRASRVPQMLVPLSSVDLGQLDRREASLLGRIDGLTTEAELATNLAWSPDETSEVLARLARMKLIRTG